MLAVLPNAPSLIHIARNRDALFNKRNRLLERLILRGLIDRASGDLAKEEPLPEQPLPLPQSAPHLLDRAFKEQIFRTGKRSRVRTTIDENLQKQVNNILKIHYNTLVSNGVHNAAAFVVENRTFVELQRAVIDPRHRAAVVEGAIGKQMVGIAADAELAPGGDINEAT